MKIKFYSLFAILIISGGYAQAQDYLIEFEGSGASTTVATVKVENLTQGTNLTMNGDNTLHLMKTITGIEAVNGNVPGEVIFYPNPMDDYTRMKFELPESGETVIVLYDFSGRKIVQKQEFLIKGEHIFNIVGIKEGIYFARINSGKYSLSGRLISSGSDNRETKIEFYNSDAKENTSLSQKEQAETKSTHAETLMQYNNGDRLKLTGVSDIYSTIIIDVPTQSKTITFEFIPCTDGDFNNYPIVRIGDQVWTAENLKTTKFNDFSPIPYATNISTPAYCWYNHDMSTYKNLYGGLYNWHAMKTGKLCPTGWHAPIDSEWAILTDYLGGASIAGRKLKEAGTNETGFTARMGGLFNSMFRLVGESGYWWAGTASTSGYYFQMFSGADNVWKGSTIARDMFSIRCVKDGSILLPSVTTNEVSGIMYNSAIIAGNVTNDGGATIIARGVCWSTSENPTIADNKTVEEGGVGEFISEITDLIAKTKYYVRAYATNSGGTTYGNQKSFTTPPSYVVIFNPDLTYGNTCDIDGNTYKTIQIGTQIWMAENLKTTKYNNSETIYTTIPTTLDITSEVTPKYQWVYEGDEINASVYGRLYTWHTINDSRKVCPQGWHVPSDSEWSTLSDYLGGLSVAGEKLKELGTHHWQSPNLGATNESGFTATPGGSRWTNGGFNNLYGWGWWWSSSTNENNIDQAWVRSLWYDSQECIRNSYYKHYGYSVRCVRDEGIILPSVRTNIASLITSNSAQSGGYVLDDGGATVTALGICWSKSPHPTVDDSITIDGSGTGTFTSSLIGLTANTLYYIRAYATNSMGTAYGNEISFKTSFTLPTITTEPVTEKSYTTAKSGGNITSDGGSTVTARGICWSMSIDPTTNDNITIDGAGSGSFVSEITDLTPNTTYYVRAYATNDAGTAYGMTLSFITLSLPPSVGLVAYYPFNGNANDESGNEKNGTVINAIPAVDRFGNITKAYCFDGNNGTERYIYSDIGKHDTITFCVWFRSPAPTTYYPHIIDYGTSNTMFLELAGDNPVYIVNGTVGIVHAGSTINDGPDFISHVSSNDTYADNQWHFVVVSYVPNNMIYLYVDNQLVKTAAYSINNPSDGLLYIGREIDDIGASQIHESHFDGSIDDIRIYDRLLTNYEIEELYNEGGYTALEKVMDIDGNSYNTVKIGTQVWMAENLSTTKYNNGDLIGTTVPANKDISSESTPKYQWAYAGNEGNVTTYGRLYTWDAVTDNRKICPTGWHVPTDPEWTELSDLLGGAGVAGGQLKESGIVHWRSPNTFGTNESGFTALPGGERHWDGGFVSLGDYGFWWSSTEYWTSLAWYRFLGYNDPNFVYHQNQRNKGYSVRCIKDK